MTNVLISTYNGERYIKEQLDSIMGQTYKDYHIYIRDDGSTDDTVAIIKNYIREKGAESVISLDVSDNIGFCKSFFALLKMAKDGDYWAFCDQDDVWLPNKLELANIWLDNNDNDIPLLYHSGFSIGNENMDIITPYPLCHFDYNFYNSITSNLFFGFAMVINGRLRELMLKANPDNIKYHDWFAAMITAAFGKYYLSEENAAIHRQYDNNASPLYFFKKIPHGIEMLKGDRFYTMQAKEFMRVYKDMLELKDIKILEWFCIEKYNPIIALKKALYYRRWNPQLKVEIVLRVLMIAGVL